MKTLKYYIYIWFAVISQTFVSCSGDDPIDNEQGTEQKEPNHDDNKDNELEKSLYQPYVTKKRISKLIIDNVSPNKGGGEDHTYYHHLFSYDDEGKIIKHVYFFLSKYAHGTNQSDTTITHIAYIGNTIKKTQYRKWGSSEYSITLNSNGFVSDMQYNKDGYLIGYKMSGYKNGDCTLQYENGNLISESKPVGSYNSTYTKYLNDTSLDLSSFLVREDIPHSSVDVPTDIEGKRSINLPKVRKITASTTNIQRLYYYEFDSQERVIQIKIQDKSDLQSHNRQYDIYHITYEE